MPRSTSCANPAIASTGRSIAWRRAGISSSGPEPALGRLRESAARPVAAGIPSLPVAQDRGECTPADPEPSALIAEQEAVPAHDPRIAGRGQREARDARAGGDANAPPKRQRARMRRDGIVGKPHLGHSDRARNQGAQAVGGHGVGGRGRESEDGPVDPIEFAKPPSCGYGVRQRPDGVALEPAHARCGGLATIGVAQAGARLAAVDAEDADHPARLA